ncbi:MAG: hypothetical protein ACJAYQ_002829 [Bacteriovoracaceae bacterium]|jgi:hypothetical protein
MMNFNINHKGEFMKNVILGLALLVSATAFAATDSSETAAGIAEAVKVFEANHDEQTIADFKGIKASPKSGGVSVTIYLNNGDKMKYGCHRHSASDPFECHHD